MNIQEKLLKIQNELKAPKNQRNSFGNYNYRSCEDILEAVKPLLLSNNLVLTLNDELVQIGDRYYVKATAKLFDDKGEISNTAYAREEEIKKGMDGSQITGASSSYARKYALNGLFLIDDVKDSDTTNQGDEYTLEDAKAYKLTFGKHKGKSLEEVKEEDGEYIDWLVKNTTSPEIATYLKLLFNIKKSDYEVDEETLQLVRDILKLVDETGTDFDLIKEHYNINSLTEVKDKDILVEIKTTLLRKKGE